MGRWFMGWGSCTPSTIEPRRGSQRQSASSRLNGAGQPHGSAGPPPQDPLHPCRLATPSSCRLECSSGILYFGTHCQKKSRSGQEVRTGLRTSCTGGAGWEQSCKLRRLRWQRCYLGCLSLHNCFQNGARDESNTSPQAIHISQPD